ncbi:MAG TPA: phenylalanine--tRNA ligase beta subunit-related protein [Anaerolineales bacterium]
MVEITRELLVVSDAWREAFPGAHAGVLAMSNVSNPAECAALEEKKNELEISLRSQLGNLDRATLRSIPMLRAYAAHYRKFDKTYHLQLQLESIAFKGKAIPTAAALVEAMFMAELNSMLLTAGHDLDLIRGQLTLDVTRGAESYRLMRGVTQSTKAGDMVISDAEGIISSIVYGPDERTQIRPETTEVIFTTYAPTGIGVEAIEAHLNEMRQNVQLVAPSARVGLLRVLSA